MAGDRSLIRVLGPIDVLTPRGVVSVGGHQPRSLLGALVMSADHAVHNDHLAWVLWGDDQPAAADATLQSYVSHLRHLIGRETIVRINHSYELDAGAIDIDVLEFERLLRQADTTRDEPDRCRRLTREALGLWRGSPFGELADDEAFTIEACRLQELRLAAMELSIESDLALGRHELVVGELEAAVKEHPYREHLWLLLVMTLARNGRRVEALRSCAELRRTLGDVGVGVGHEIADLEREILAGDPIGERG
ncbi:MAG: AfsR/SARP family transcriptional regulator [Ilumatobacteraceae bacterium]